MTGLQAKPASSHFSRHFQRTQIGAYLEQGTYHVLGSCGENTGCRTLLLAKVTVLCEQNDISL